VASWIKWRIGIGNSLELTIEHGGPQLDNDLYGHVVENAVEHQTLLSLARVAIALECFKQLNKRYPENLAVLVAKFLAELPPDPWAEEIGDPLHYVMRPGGRPAVLSVGSDRNNDGGWVADDDRNALWQYGWASDDPGPRRYADPNVPSPRRRIPAREILH